MELEKKHLAPYLPFGIPARLSKKGIFNQDDEYPNPRTNELGIIKNISFWDTEITGQLHVSETYSFDFDEIDEIEIILHPLSDYKKIHEITDEMEEFEILMVDDDPSFVLKLPFNIVELMFKNHIDVFGLIPERLAIDINTLT